MERTIRTHGIICHITPYLMGYEVHYYDGDVMVGRTGTHRSLRLAITAARHAARTLFRRIPPDAAKKWRRKIPVKFPLAGGYMGWLMLQRMRPQSWTITRITWCNSIDGDKLTAFPKSKSPRRVTVEVGDDQTFAACVAIGRGIAEIVKRGELELSGDKDITIPLDLALQIKSQSTFEKK